MNVLRNRFLNTTALLFDPREPTGGAQQDDTGDAGDDVGDDTGAEAEQDAGDAGDGAESDGDGEDGGFDDGSDAGADDPDLADLPPEVRVKARAAIERGIAKETGWRDRRIAKLHARNRSAQEDVTALETIADPARRSAQQQEDPNRKFTAEDVKTEAARLRAQDDYDTKANDTDAQGVATYRDKWKTTMAKLPKLGGIDVNDMVDILNTDQPHVVLFQLADPEIYERVMALSPARRRNEFVKLSLKEVPKPRAVIGESKRPGAAPAPVVPVGSGRRVAAQQVDLHNDKIPDDAWYEARNATRRKKFSDHA